MREAGRPAGLVHATEFEPLQDDEPANEVHFRLWPGASLCCTSPRFEYDWSAKFYGTPVRPSAAASPQRRGHEAARNLLLPPPHPLFLFVLNARGR